MRVLYNCIVLMYYYYSIIIIYYISLYYSIFNNYCYCTKSSFKQASPSLTVLLDLEILAICPSFLCNHKNFNYISIFIYLYRHKNFNCILILFIYVVAQTVFLPVCICYLFVKSYKLKYRLTCRCNSTNRLICL